MHDLWIAMAGSAGVGKSTLTERIGATLKQQRNVVDTFGEEELFTRPGFSRVAAGFRTKCYPSPEEFETAYESWLQTLSTGTVGIMDWNPAGMAGDLPWATSDRTRFRRHLQAVRRLARGRVLLFHLQVSAEIAVDRAGRGRGEEWLNRSDRIAWEAGHRQADRIDRIVAEAFRHAEQTRDELRVAIDAGWPIHTIEAGGGPQDVHDRAIAVIDTVRG